MPEKIRITDTSFRDGMQSLAPYSVEEMVETLKKRPLCNTFEVQRKVQNLHRKIDQDRNARFDRYFKQQGY